MLITINAIILSRFIKKSYNAVIPPNRYTMRITIRIDAGIPVIIIFTYSFLIFDAKKNIYPSITPNIDIIIEFCVVSKFTSNNSVNIFTKPITAIEKIHISINDGKIVL